MITLTQSVLTFTCATLLTAMLPCSTVVPWKDTKSGSESKYTEMLAAPQELSRVVGFALIDGRILINVRMNGQGPFRMIFDSGAAAVVSPEVARILKLRTSSSYEGSGTGASPISVSSASVEHVRIGPLDLTDQRFDVVSMDDMPPVFGSIRIDGIIGRPVFSRATVQVDYDKRQLTFFDPQSFAPLPSETSIPFTRLREVPLIEGSLDGQKGRFGVDLGARSSLILTAFFVEKSGIGNRYHASPEMIAGWGLGGPIHARLARAGKFQFGKFEMDSPLVRLSTQKTGLLGRSDTAGLIGADILRQFTITFDDKHGLIYFRPSRRFGEPMSFDKSGMWLVQDGKEFSVMEVTPGGAADKAQLRTGDRIIGVDGTRTEALLLPSLRERWAQALDGTRVVLEIKHDGAVRTVSLVLFQLI